MRNEATPDSGMAAQHRRRFRRRWRERRDGKSRIGRLQEANDKGQSKNSGSEGLWKGNGREEEDYDVDHQLFKRGREMNASRTKAA